VYTPTASATARKSRYSGEQLLLVLLLLSLPPGPLLLLGVLLVVPLEPLLLLDVLLVMPLVLLLMLNVLLALFDTFVAGEAPFFAPEALPLLWLLL
jgi:hypothetical protein